MGSSLYLAACHGHTAVVDTLLKAGANVNQAGSGKETPIYVAANNGKRDVVQLLLQAGADINLCSNEGNTVMVSTFLPFLFFPTNFLTRLYRSTGRDTACPLTLLRMRIRTHTHTHTHTRFQIHVQFLLP